MEVRVMRFVLWQQAFLLIGFVGLLVAYIIGTYRFTTGNRPALALLLRLGAMVAIGSVIWMTMGLVLFSIAGVGLADISVRYHLVEKTYNSTFGFPFTISFWEMLHSVVADRGVLELLIAVTIPLMLLLVGGLVVVADRVLADGPLAIHRHSRAYVGLLGSTALVVLIVQLWPQPSRNLEMAAVPIPEGALNVKYGHTDDTHRWPTTSFTVEGQSVSVLLGYYRSTLEAGGWQLERGDVYAEYATGPGTALFSRNDSLLEVNVPGGPAGAYAMLTLRRGTPTELTELRKTLATSIPAPVPSNIPLTRSPEHASPTTSPDIR
jgi:hypothetical protein